MRPIDRLSLWFANRPKDDHEAVDEGLDPHMWVYLVFLLAMWALIASVGGQ